MRFPRATRPRATLGDAPAPRLNFETLVSDPTAGEPAASRHPIVAIGITPANPEAAIPFVRHSDQRHVV